jgi:hypothetical protein
MQTFISMARVSCTAERGRCHAVCLLVSHQTVKLQYSHGD